MSTENTQDSKQPAIPPLPPATGSADFDDYPDGFNSNKVNGFAKANWEEIPAPKEP
jgi:hypothetical protein